MLIEKETDQDEVDRVALERSKRHLEAVKKDLEGVSSQTLILNDNKTEDSEKILITDSVVLKSEYFREFEKYD